MFEHLKKRSPAYRRISRHLQLLADYAGPRKLANAARTEMARMRGDIVVKTRPFIYTVDIGNVCNLRCPLCPTGTHDLGRPQSFMELAEFERILEKIKPWAFEVVLHNWGEPFLHPQFLEIVRATKRAGVGSAVSSNLNLVGRGAEFLREVVESGLDHLVVSIDGTTQEVYEQYRRGGSLDHVMANLKELVAIKRELGSRSPNIEWQFLMMRHNEGQADEARRIAAEIGVDDLRFTGAGLPFDDLADLELGEQWLSTDPQYRDGYDPARIQARGYLYDEKCFYLYRAMTVNPRGEVAPCCAIHRQEWDFGNLLESSLEEVWNNAHYRTSRALFSRQSHESDIETACHRCPLFRHEGHDGGRSGAEHGSIGPARGWST